MIKQSWSYRWAFVAYSVLLTASPAFAQHSLIYQRLPVGKYPVGFKIFTLIDDTRVVKPEYNYVGEKNEGDRRYKINVHLWYPARTNSAGTRLVYGDYCYNDQLGSTNETIGKERRDQALQSRRRSVENWFGKTTNETWSKLTTTPMLAVADAELLLERFPLLIGTLRSLSTSITNEMLASNGYVVAMLRTEGSSSFVMEALHDITDMRLVMSHLQKHANIDSSRVGTFGFSGSGFSQVLFAMNEPRVKAVADIESGIYMDNLYQNFSASNYYQPNKLRVPFLHIFSRDLSKQEKFISDFETKTSFSKRYRLLLNQPALHHWDVAAEGYTAAIFLNNRGTEEGNIRRSFEIASWYLLNFFDAELKRQPGAIRFLSERPTIPGIPGNLWDVSILAAAHPAPGWEDFRQLVDAKGLEQALKIARETLRVDTLSELMTWYFFNGYGYSLLNEKKYKEAVQVFELNTELHPNDPNLYDSLAEAYELSGENEKMRLISTKALNILNNKKDLSVFEKGLKTNAEKRLK